MTNPARSWFRGAVGAGSTTAVTRLALETVLRGGGDRWTRTNHRGAPVSLLEGPAVAAGLLAGGVLAAPSRRGALAVASATAGAAVLGLVDDLGESAGTRAKGLRGHLGALRRGRLTTGGLKVLGIGASSLVAAALATPRPPSGRRLTWAVDVLSSGALIAGCANLVNLFDLRPGRALKVAAIVSAPVAIASRDGAGLAGAVLGAATGAARADLRGTDMLGDGGANAIGAALGTAVVLDTPRSVRWGLLAGVVALTLASERVSFTEVIARTPVLRAVDHWGRRESVARQDAARGAVG